MNIVKLFVKTEKHQQQILEECGKLFSIQEATPEESDIAISDDVTIFKNVKDSTRRFYVGPETKNVIDDYFKVLDDVNVNAYFAMNDDLPVNVAEEGSKIANDFMYRGLMPFSDQEHPIVFDTILTSDTIGMRIDDIYSYIKGKINESSFRNILTSLFMLTFAVKTKDKTSRVDVEFILHEEKFIISASTRSKPVSTGNILAYLKEHRSTCRNLIEDAGLVSITYSNNAFKISASCGYKKTVPQGINIFSSMEKTEDIERQLEKDRKEELNYVNFGEYLDEQDVKRKEETAKKNKENGQSISGSNGEEDGINKTAGFRDDQSSMQISKSNWKEEDKGGLASGALKDAQDVSQGMENILKSGMDDQAKLREIEKLMKKQEVAGKRLQQLAENYENLKKENSDLKDKLSDQKRKGMSGGAGGSGDSKGDSSFIVADEDELRNMLEKISASDDDKKMLERAIENMEKRFRASKMKEQDLTERKESAEKKVGILTKSTAEAETKARGEETRATKAETQIRAMQQQQKKMEQTEKIIRRDKSELSTSVTKLRAENQTFKKELKMSKVEGERLKDNVAKLAKSASGGAENKKKDTGKELIALKKDFSAKERALTTEITKQTNLLTKVVKSNDSNERQLKDMRDKATDLASRLTKEQKDKTKAENEYKAALRKIEQLEVVMKKLKGAKAA